MKKFLLMTVALFTASVTMAYSVKGVVVNQAGEPLEFATYRIYSATDTVKPVAYGVTDGTGVFDRSLNAAGTYTARASSVGLADAVVTFAVSDDATAADLGKLVCGDVANMLGEVTVTATKPLVTKEIDRLGYDVKADVEAPTSNLQDILRKVPLVSVDPDGTIKVRGSSDFKIYKNGRPDNSFTRNAKEIFKAIPASMVRKIEVITDPGAREDAEGVGAILNIVTEQGSSLKGIMANVGLNYSTLDQIPSPNLWGSAQIDKVTLSAYAGLNSISRLNNERVEERQGIYRDSGRESRSLGHGYAKGLVSWWGIDASYELDSLNLFTIEFGGYSYSAKTRSHSSLGLFEPDGATVYAYESGQTVDPTSYLDFNGNFNYQRSTSRKGEALTLSYMISTTRQGNRSLTEYTDAVNMPVDYTGVFSDYHLNFMEHTFQLDWTRPLNERHTIDLGAKYIFRDNNSTTAQEYLGTDRRPLTDFTHHTHIAAAFADWRARLGRFGLRAGVRYEYSRLTASYADDVKPGFGSSLNDVVPNAAVSFNINDSNTLKVSYGTRISRPGISYLNPAVNETPTQTSQGNPDLGSSRYNSVDLNYSLISKKLTLDLSAGYRFTDNGIISVVNVADDRTYSNYANAGHDKAFNASIFAQWMAGSKTTVMLNANATYNHYANPSLGITKGGWGGFSYMRLTQKLLWKLTAAIGLNYWAGMTNLYSSYRPVGLAGFGYNISLSRNFLKEDRLSVRLMLRNPFYPGRIRYRSKGYNTSYLTDGYDYAMHNKSFGVGISYRLGSMKGSVKKTSAKISNDDLIGRKKE